MPSSDGEAARPMIENQARKVADALASEAPLDGKAAPRPPPPGHVERVLTMRDRNLIVGACISLCGRDGHKKAKDQENLHRVKRLLSFDETLEYFAMNNDWAEEERIKWEGARARYRAWFRWSQGVVTTDDLLRAHPGFGLDEKKLPVQPPKPPHQPPRLKPEEYRGPERAFHIPPALDVWMAQAIKEMSWPTERDDMTEGAVELGRKFGILDRE